MGMRWPSGLDRDFNDRSRCWENLAFFAALFGVDDGNALREILDLVDLTDRPRNTPAYELPSGSGKTTLIRLLAASASASSRRSRWP